MRIIGWVGLIFGLLALYPMGLFATEPLVWEWMGQPSEIYPEWIYLLFGIPAAVLAILSGAPVALVKPQGPRVGWTLWVAVAVNLISVALCLYLLGFALWQYAT